MKRGIFNLNGRTAVITGAARGLGKAMAEALAANGAKVLIAEIDEDEAVKTARQLSENGLDAAAVYVDVTSEDSVNEMMESALEKFSKIDILVNNAGIGGGEPVPENLKKEVWDKIIAVNLTGCFLCSKIVGQQMIKRKYGKIINIASMSGIIVNRLTGKHNPAYCVSKAGVIMLTKVLAAEWAKYSINVNAIAPTYFDTEMANKAPELVAEMQSDIPMGRLGRPEELGGTVVYLASEASDFVTGHTILVDGGYTVW